MKTIFQLYRAKNRQFAWRAKRSGRIVADGAETYTRHLSAMRSLQRFLRSIREQDYVVDDQSL